MRRLRFVLRYSGNIIFISFLIISNFVLIGTGKADNTHYNSTLIGERATGMGGAFTAISDNTAGLFYNPAGVVHSEGQLLSGSVNIFQFTDKQYKGFYNDQEFNKTAFGIVGAYTGYITPLGLGKIGFSIAVPDSVKEEVQHEWLHVQGWEYQDDSGEINMEYFGEPFATEAILEIDHEYNVYHFGPSYALPINSQMSVGLTLYAHYKKLREIKLILKQAQLETSLTDGSLSTYFNDYSENYSRNFTEMGIKPILGIQYRNHTFAFGFALSHTLLFDSEDEYREIVSIRRHSNHNDLTWANSSSLSHYNVKSTDKREYPVNIRGGVSLYITPNWLLASDLSYYTSSKRRVFSKGIERSFEDDSVLDVALGTECKINKNYFFRMGIFTDFASTPSSDLELYEIESEHVDLYGFSLSISRQHKKGSYITLGTTIKRGEGKACLREDPELILDVSQFSLSLFISAAI